MVTIVDKLRQYLINKGISVSVAEKEIGLSNGSLAKPFNLGTTIKTDTLEKFLKNYKDINSEWLLSDKGEMLKNAAAEKTIRRNLIPLYDDIITITSELSEMSEILGNISYSTNYIDAGNLFMEATAAIRHYDRSMVEYPSGSILALKKVEDLRLLIWGTNYCIETTEYRIIKKLNKSKKVTYLTAYSSNIEKYSDGCLVYEPMEIPIEIIRSVYQVLGCIVKEYSKEVV